MKKYFLFILLTLVFNVVSAQDKEVTLTVSAQGKNSDEAKSNALRAAIEQAFGAYISTNTTILNDSIVKEEVVSVSNGNIKKYEIVNEATLPNGGAGITLKTTVSINKLTSFCVAKGVKVEFEGGLFAENIMLQKLQEENELKSWKSTFDILMKLADNSFDKKLKVGEPTLQNQDRWIMPLSISIVATKNYENILKQIYTFSKSISLSEIEKDNYLKLGKPVYGLSINLENQKIEKFYFRNKPVRDGIGLMPWYIFSQLVYNTGVDNGIDTLKFTSSSVINISFIDSTSNPFITRKNGDRETNLFLFSTNKYNGKRAGIYKTGDIGFSIINSERERSFTYGEPMLPDNDYIGNPEGDTECILNAVAITNFFTHEFKYSETLDNLKKIKSYKIIELPFILHLAEESLNQKGKRNPQIMMRNYKQQQLYNRMKGKVVQ